MDPAYNLKINAELLPLMGYDAKKQELIGIMAMNDWCALLDYIVTHEWRPAELYHLFHTEAFLRIFLQMMVSMDMEVMRDILERRVDTTNKVLVFLRFYYTFHKMRILHAYTRARFNPEYALCRRFLARHIEDINAYVHDGVPST
jgi:hypothetical protein